MKIDREIIKTFEDWSGKSPNDGQSLNEGKRFPAGTSYDTLKDQIAKASVDTVVSIEGLPVGWEDVLTEAKPEFGLVRICAPILSRGTSTRRSHARQRTPSGWP
jgi:hypothetical protein